jgi:hypothetical protein
MPGKKKKITFIVPALSLVFQSLLTHPTLVRCTENFAGRNPKIK